MQGECDLVIGNDVDVRKLSLAELQEIKRRWFEMANQGGKVEAAQLVALGLGQRVRDDFVYEATENGQRILFKADRHLGGVVVLVNDKRVLDTRRGEGLFVPGGWELVLDRLYSHEQKMLEMRDQDARREQQRQLLIDELLLEE